MKLAIVTASLFGTESLDKNGKQAVILVPVAGKMPNRNVIAGTIAERSGLEIGKSYLVNVKEGEKHEKFGRQFNFQKVMEINSVIDVVATTKELGEGMTYDAGAPVTAEEIKEAVA